jgi:hypothetical protein
VYWFGLLFYMPCLSWFGLFVIRIHFCIFCLIIWSGFFIKCISTNVSARYDYTFSSNFDTYHECSFLLFDIVKGGEKNCKHKLWIKSFEFSDPVVQHICKMASTKGELRKWLALLLFASILKAICKIAS